MFFGVGKPFGASVKNFLQMCKFCIFTGLRWKADGSEKWFRAVKIFHSHPTKQERTMTIKGGFKNMLESQIHFESFSFVHWRWKASKFEVWCVAQLNLKAEVSRNSRSRPFPGIPASHFPSQKLGMILSFPSPKVGNGIFCSLYQNFPFPLTSPGIDYQGRE